jgi:hypothetical protein
VEKVETIIKKVAVVEDPKINCDNFAMQTAN